jgi:ATP-dependent protease ClpP protease subunit
MHRWAGNDHDHEEGLRADSRVPGRSAMNRPATILPDALSEGLCRPAVRLLGSIDQPSATSFLDQLAAAPQTDPILVEVFSSGGDADLGRRLGQEVRLLREILGRDLWFLGKTLVASAAVTLMAAFPTSRRWLSADTTLLIHGRRISKDMHLDGPLAGCRRVIEEVIADIDNGLRLEKEDFTRLIAESTISLEEIEAQACGGWHLTAREALERGLVRGVL